MSFPSHLRSQPFPCRVIANDLRSMIVVPPQGERTLLRCYSHKKRSAESDIDLLVERDPDRLSQRSCHRVDFRPRINLKSWLLVIHSVDVMGESGSGSRSFYHGRRYLGRVLWHITNEKICSLNTKSLVFNELTNRFYESHYLNLGSASISRKAIRLSIFLCALLKGFSRYLFSPTL